MSAAVESAGKDTATMQAATPKEPSTLKLIMTLGLAGLLAGLVIVLVFEWTAPTIAANQARRLREAVFKVVPGSSSMQEMAFRDGKLARRDGEQGAAYDDAPVIYAALSEDGALMGYAIPGDGAGFQDQIALIYGYDAARKRVVGIQILQSRETPGLGDKIYKDAKFVANFDDLAVEPQVVVVKNGQRAAPNEVDAITGATISSKAVVNIINRTNETWLPRIAGVQPDEATQARDKPRPAPDRQHKDGVVMR